MPEDISIIIVSWNVRGMLKDCLKSIFSTIINSEFEVIVVDNASADGTIEMLKEDFHEVTIISNRSNVGFAKANNQAILRAKGRYLLLLNPDTILCPATIDTMKKYMDIHPRLGILGCKIIGIDGTLDHNCAKLLPCFREFVFTQLISNGLWSRYRKWRVERKIGDCNIPCISGACMLLRGIALNEVGGSLDETLPMYLEDIDICARMQAGGWSVRYLPSVSIVHLAGMSTKRSTNVIALEILVYEGYYRFLLKHRGNVMAYTYRAMVAIGAIIRIIANLIKRIFALFLVHKQEMLRSKNETNRFNERINWSLRRLLRARDLFAEGSVENDLRVYKSQSRR